MNKGHFVPASKTSEFIANKGLTFKQLKKELPELDGDPAQSQEENQTKSQIQRLVVQACLKARRSAVLLNATNVCFPVVSMVCTQ